MGGEVVEREERKKDLIASLHRLNIVYKERGEGIPLKRGEVSDYYLDVKKAYGYPAERKKTADEL